MYAKSKSWLAGGMWKPKNPHSLEHLKYLHAVLCKNQNVTDQNRNLLVETLRSISEILIWGDQNDSTVFDFFLEKNMLVFFIRFMRQKSGGFICTQLLQTLNILFENIKNETSVYFLLSNNHINSIIVHKFDFSDEEVMAYYISFLKTLSLKLNKHTVHFFYNENTNDFALYSEAIKFFNHPENMVRIAVRTITLNVYRVDEPSMLQYIGDKSASPYFSNLVWLIGNHVLLVDSCVRNDVDHRSRDRLADLVAEHLNHLHYLNDILSLHVAALNDLLTTHLLNNLFIPLYVYSLRSHSRHTARMGKRPHMDPSVSLFLLSQVFLIISHPPLVRQLADIIFNCETSVVTACLLSTHPLGTQGRARSRESSETGEGSSTFYEDSEDVTPSPQSSDASVPEVSYVAPSETRRDNSTDEEKALSMSQGPAAAAHPEFSFANRPYLQTVFAALDPADGDYAVLFALCLLYALGHNTGINQDLLDTILMPTDKSASKADYNVTLVEKLISIITVGCQNGSRVRLATLEMALLLLQTVVYRDGHCDLRDCHLAAMEGAKEDATLLLRNFYKVWQKSEEIFLDMFEDEYREMKTHPLNVEYLTMDASILLAPTGTPLTGIQFNKRLPCGEVEHARMAIRVFFLLRKISLQLKQESETQLPLTSNDDCVKVGAILDLNNSDLIACTLITKEGRKERRFLVIDLLQMILVEPESRRLGWGVVMFVGFLQDVELSGDKENSRALHITVHRPSLSVHARPLPLLSARFLFDDHIRCMAAKQRLAKGRLKARQRKMQMIARLLDMPPILVDAIYQPPGGGGHTALRRTVHAAPIPGRSHPVAAQTTSVTATRAGRPGRADRATVAPPGGPSTVAPLGTASTVAPPGGPSTVAPPGGPSTVAPPGAASTVTPPGGPSTVAPPSGPSTVAPPGVRSGTECGGARDTSSDQVRRSVFASVSQLAAFDDVCQQQRRHRQRALLRGLHTKAQRVSSQKAVDAAAAAAAAAAVLEPPSAAARGQQVVRAPSRRLAAAKRAAARRSSSLSPQRSPSPRHHQHAPPGSCPVSPRLSALALSCAAARGRPARRASLDADADAWRPKSLAPAGQPAASLVCEPAARGSQAPRLLPPADRTNEASVGASPLLAGVSRVELAPPAAGESAARRLSRLAATVSQHYHQGAPPDVATTAWPVRNAAGPHDEE